MMHPLRKIRTQRNLTLAEVASAVGIDTASLSRIETGKQITSPDNAAKLAQYFGGAVNELQILYPNRAPKRRSRAAA